MFWKKINGIVTPGGEAMYECPNCQDVKSRHLYGVETPNPLDKCPVCGEKLEYPNAICFIGNSNREKMTLREYLEKNYK